MASSRTMQQAPIGSRTWIEEENTLSAQYIDQEVEEFTFAVRNELEWLNEHMSEVFSREHFDVVEAFKTPGKLRGKTPWTARRVNPLNEQGQEAATNFLQPPPVFRLPSPATSKKQVTIEVREDVNEHHVTSPQAVRYSSGLGKENAQSGSYDALSRLSRSGMPTSATSSDKMSAIIPDDIRVTSPVKSAHAHSLQQSQGDLIHTQDEASTTSPAVMLDSEAALPFDQLLEENIAHQADSDKVVNEEDIVIDDEPEEDAEFDVLQQEDVHSSSPSEVSLPPTSVLRKKGSLNFASLPARDPITTKQSLGARLSRISQHERLRVNGGVRESQLGSAQRADDEEEELDEMDLDDQPEKLKSGAVEQSKTSTQRLHEKFALLGKTGTSRLSKSIPSFVAQAQAPEKSVTQRLAAEHDENDDDWIPPIGGGDHAEQQRKSPLGFSKAATEFDSAELTVTRGETVAQVATDEHAKVPSVAAGATNRAQVVRSPKSKLPTISYPKLNHHVESTTPAGSPIRASNTPAGSPIRSRVHEGAMSASKNKLFSVLKSAKGLFASNNVPEIVPENDSVSTEQRPTIQRVIYGQEIEQKSRRSTEKGDAITRISEKPTTARRSSDRLRKMRVSEDGGHDEGVAQSSSSARSDLDKDQPMVDEAEEEITPADELEDPVSNMPVPQSKSMLPTSQLQKPAELRRPLRAGMRPAPVTIKLASQRIGQPAGVIQDSIPMPSSSLRPPTLSKKASTTAIQTLSSTQNWKTASSTARPKALDIAAKKKEQEEREAQRRAEQKRELERKRAAKAEEDRRAAQEAEQKKALEAKNAAQRQAAEQRRAGAIRRNEELRERAAKAEPLAKRTLTRSTAAEDARTAAPVLNTSKAVKRPLGNDVDDESGRQTVKQEPKRRRTSQMFDAVEEPSRPVMAPPIRPSNMHKNHTFTTTTTTTAPSMFKATVTAQHNLQHAPKTPHYTDYAKHTSSKGPFSEIPNPPGTTTTTTTTQKIPLKNPSHPSPSQFPAGDTIELPTIYSDAGSSDSDDDGSDGNSKSFVPPDWANSPVLRDLLRQQQLVDPLQVFGPIAPLVMEEVFKGNKERQAKFRARTSSAVWTRDQLTAEEVRRDREARERMDREGGWSFRPNA